VEANSVLEDKPNTINQSPEADGWLAKIEVADPAEVDSLMDAEAYKAFTEDADH
jgi:glycine cleavage system H protein